MLPTATGHGDYMHHGTLPQLCVVLHTSLVSRCTINQSINHAQYSGGVIGHFCEKMSGVCELLFCALDRASESGMPTM